MTKTLNHRGPDAGDVWQDKQLPLYLGHRRLAIQDLSSSGAQPMISATERFVIVYNGEIYNAPVLRAELNIPLRGHSDTEIILAAIDTWGVDKTLQKLNGMFAFALYDTKAQEIYFARDRFGKKPLYIGWAGESLVFASELKALRAHPDFKPRLNRRAVDLYMRYAAIPAPHCIYDHVWMLPPAHTMKIELKTLKAGQPLTDYMSAYWQADDVATKALRFSGSEQDAIEQLETLLLAATQERMISDVPLGAFLSGGIDSSTITALMQACASRPVKTYSIGFHEDGFDEAAYARKVAAHLGTDHHELYVTQKDALNVIPSLPELYDEPFGDISAIPTALVSQFARRDVSVALSGDGGDEMLGGYRRYTELPRLWSAVKHVPRFIGHLLPENSKPAQKFKAIIGEKDKSVAYDAMVSHWNTSSVRMNYKTNPDRSFAENMMLWDIQGYLPSTILTKVDRASMGHSLEVRAPLLDTRIFEFAQTLPLEYKIRGKTGKWILRHVLQKYVPAALFDRPKQGFSMPVGAWLRGELRNWGEDLLTQEIAVLDMRDLRATWNAHQNGQGDYGVKLWTALMFLAWYQKWMTGE